MILFLMAVTPNKIVISIEIKEHLDSRKWIARADTGRYK